MIFKCFINFDLIDFILINYKALSSQLMEIIAILLCNEFECYLFSWIND